jgi:hypothetical protein
MSRTDLMSIIRSLNTVFIESGICHTSYVDCLLARSGPHSLGSKACPFSEPQKAFHALYSCNKRSIFGRVRKTAKSHYYIRHVCLSVCHSFLMHGTTPFIWTNLHKICLSIFRKSVGKIQV